MACEAFAHSSPIPSLTRKRSNARQYWEYLLTDLQCLFQLPCTRYHAQNTHHAHDAGATPNPCILPRAKLTQPAITLPSVQRAPLLSLPLPFCRIVQVYPIVLVYKLYKSHCFAIL